MTPIAAVIFDWGDTVMRDFDEYDGAMVTWPRVELVPGVAEALQALEGRFILALASNAGASDAGLMGQALERVAIRRFFGEHLYTSKELGARKPAPEFFLGVASRLGVAPEACVMVGNDYVKDISGAAAVGMRTIWLAQADATGGDLATRRIGAMESLPQALADLER